MSQVLTSPVEASLLACFGLYWLLAEARFGRTATAERLEQLAALEAEALSGELGSAEALRMHAVGLSRAA